MTEQHDSAGELKPCPFCGSGNVSDSYYIKGGGNMPTGYYVECENCCAGGPAIDDSVLGSGKADAITAWNTRTGPAMGRG